ncbi:MAG: NADH-quinone oxidoreductase subunit J, partial [Bacteroidetes bacterium]|nr:NADH-quinone oxidoreductase subunit J [Bacteroidota bacterium]
NYEFLGAVQIVVYVGGIVVLIIFSIFLTAESGSDMKKPNFIRALFSALASTFACALTLLFINAQSFNSNMKEMVEPSVRNIGRQMLSTTEYGYILPFEVISILLLAAMIGCIVIAIKIKSPQSLEDVEK